ncbi:hypothetical protein Tco_1575569 [Tanacetum coccineum]
MTTPITTNGTDSQMHNNIMDAVNSEALKKCNNKGPYVPSTVVIPAQPTTDNSKAVAEQTVIKDLSNMSTENKAHYKAEKEAIHMLLTGIGDEIYSTVDACNTAHEMWVAIKRLQQGESLNVQDVKTNLFWDLVNLLHEMESQLNHTTLARNANPLALVAATQRYPDPYYQAPKPQRSYPPAPKQHSSTRSNVSTRHKGKEIAKTITSPSESASEEDSYPEQAQKDKEMTVTVVGARETVCTQVVLQTGIQCFNCKEFGRVQETKKGTRLHVSQGEDVDVQTMYNDAEYNAFANERQHSEQPESINNRCVVEKIHSNVIPDSLNMCNNDIQTDQKAEECDDDRVALANLIANLTLDTEENKKILKQLKNTRDSCLIALQNKEIELEKYKTYLNRTTEYDTLELSKGKGLLGPNGGSGGKFEGGFGGNVGSCGGNGGRGGEEGGVEKNSLMGSKFMDNGEECLDGWVRADGGEVKGGGVDFGVSRTLLGEILGEIMGEGGGKAFRIDGGAV